MSRIGFVTGLLSEADCLDTASGTRSEIYDLRFAAGGSPGRALAGAHMLVDQGATALVSFGIAGALTPELAPGDIIIGSKVLNGAGAEFSADTDWAKTLVDRLVRAHKGTMMTTEHGVASPREKARLHRQSNAIAVDMESAGVAAAAAERSIPFIAIRAIADSAARSIPQSALVGLAPDGTTRPLAVMGQLALRPWELPALMRLGSDTATAMKSLRRVAALGLGFHIRV